MLLVKQYTYVIYYGTTSQLWCKPHRLHKSHNYVILSSIYIQKPHMEHNYHPYTKSLKSIIYIYATDTVYTVLSNAQNHSKLETVKLSDRQIFIKQFDNIIIMYLIIDKSHGSWQSILRSTISTQLTHPRLYLWNKCCVSFQIYMHNAWLLWLSLSHKECITDMAKYYSGSYNKDTCKIHIRCYSYCPKWCIIM